MRQIPSVEYLEAWAPDNPRSDNYSKFQELLRLRRELGDHPASLIHKTLERLERGRYMLSGNYGELISAIDEYEDPDSSATHSDEEIFHKLMEFNRRFNNYVMTVTNQRDYVNKEIANLKHSDGGVEVESAYKSKIQELSIDLHGLFFTHIRNMFAHDFVPSASGRIRFDTSTMDEPERKIIIQKQPSAK